MTTPTKDAVPLRWPTPERYSLRIRHPDGTAHWLVAFLVHNTWHMETSALQPGVPYEVEVYLDHPEGGVRFWHRMTVTL